jgi:hypothetical protein
MVRFRTKREHTDEVRLSQQAFWGCAITKEDRSHLISSCKEDFRVLLARGCWFAEEYRFTDPRMPGGGRSLCLHERSDCLGEAQGPRQIDPQTLLGEPAARSRGRRRLPSSVFAAPF